MSTLNLIPDLELLCAHTGIFLANLVVVKSLIITPYLALQKKRRALTADRHDEAVKILADCAQHSQELESRVKATYREAAHASEERKAHALVAQKALIVEAKKNADTALEAMRQEIAALVQRESKKIPFIAQELSKEFYHTLTR
jgi:F0F1-type ATP synthase membrane subunit b/b'